MIYHKRKERIIHIMLHLFLILRHGILVILHIHPLPHHIPLRIPLLPPRHHHNQFILIIISITCYSDASYD